jgi:hypothetical protein
LLLLGGYARPGEARHGEVKGEVGIEIVRSEKGDMMSEMS